MNTSLKILILILFFVLLTKFILSFFKERKRSNLMFEKILNDIKIYKNNSENFQYKIPKNIIQCCLDKNNIDPKFLENIEYIKKLNPDWKYTLYDNSEQEKFISKYYPQYLKYYKAINPKYGAAISDFFRYIIIYDQGGIYLDLKSAMKYPLNDIIHPNDEFILSHWGSVSPHENILKKHGEFQQWHIICVKKHPLIKQVINKVIDNIRCYDKDKDGVGKIGVLRITGPIPYTKAMLQSIHLYNIRILKNHSDLGLIYNNLNVNHEKVFGKSHYSNCNEDIILDKQLICSKSSLDQNKELSVDLSLKLFCKNIVEINNDNIILYNNELMSQSKIINKTIKDLTLEDFKDYYPIKCIIIHCIHCLHELIDTKIGKIIIENSFNIIVKYDDENIKNILNDNDFTLVEKNHSNKYNTILSIYSKLIIPRNYNLY